MKSTVKYYDALNSLHFKIKTSYGNEFNKGISFPINIRKVFFLISIPSVNKCYWKNPLRKAHI